MNYREYTDDADHMNRYREYQRRYAERIRESDKLVIDLVRSKVGDGVGKTLVDVGCSTGNLLLHLKRLIPALSLHGIDMVASIIEENRQNPSLDGIKFSGMDMLAVPPDFGRFDITVANAALMFFTPEQFELAIAALARMTRPGGFLIVFDLFHPFDEAITIMETSHEHPRGLTFSFRSQRLVSGALEKASMLDAEFRMFHMPFDLPRSSDASDLTSYTVTTIEGDRLSFRGALYQPWCHLVARKA
jgi:SAM-dependent methyltransferase